MKKRADVSNMDRAIAELNTPYHICTLAHAFERDRPGLSFAACCFALGTLTNAWRTIEKDLDAIVTQYQCEQSQRAVAS